MIEHLETNLRRALAQYADEVPGQAAARLRGVDYRPRSPRVRSALALTGAIAAFSGSAIAVALSGLGAETPRAWAGWTPSPIAAAGSTKAVEVACVAHLRAYREVTPSNAGWRVLLSDTRGPFTMLILSSASGSHQASCFSGPSWGSYVTGGVGWGARRNARPAAGRVRVEWFNQSEAPSATHASYTQITGRTGSGVSAVAVVLSDGTSVRASVAGGWFLAWWPGTTHASLAEVVSSRGTAVQRIAW